MVKRPLSRGRLLQAGIELADERGVEWLSMREMAKHLGCGVMSLYNHIANKDDLLEGMLDLVCGEIEDPAADTDWKAGLHFAAVSAHQMLLSHRWAATLWSQQFPGPERWRTSETILRLLTQGGFTDHQRDLGFHAITLHVTGFTQQQLSYESLDPRAAELYGRFEREVSEEEFPMMVDHVRYHQQMDQIPGERPDEFRFVLGLILDGLERSRDESKRAETPSYSATATGSGARRKR